MTDEQVQQVFDGIDTRLGEIQAILESILLALETSGMELKEEIAAIANLPQAAEQQRILRDTANQDYLSGRWQRIDGDGYNQPAPVRKVTNDDNPSGAV